MGLLLPSLPGWMSLHRDVSRLVLYRLSPGFPVSQAFRGQTLQASERVERLGM